MAKSLIRCDVHPDRFCRFYWRGIRFCKECWAEIHPS